MLERFIIRMKIGRLSCMIKAMENDIFKYRRDMTLMNDLYYCGRGDVETYINEWSSNIYWRIATCERLKWRLSRRLDRLNNVVGA
jgi:hypothetical protein